MTTDNYLSELVGGELEASVTGGAQRLYIDNSGAEGVTAFVFTGGTGGVLTMTMDYPLAAGDRIKYKAIAGSSDKLKLSDADDADHNTLLVGTGTTEVQYFDVPADWAGATTLKLERNNNSPRIPYLEVYRRPVVTGVSLNDMTLREGVTATPVMTLTPSDALVTSQAWSILSGNDKITINATTGAVTADAEGDAEIKVILNGDPTISATANIHVVQSFAQADVTTSMLWDWKDDCWAGQADVQLTGDDKDADILMANTGTSIVNNDDFRSDMLVINGQYSWRKENANNIYFQGSSVKFHATVAGLVRVYYRGTGNSAEIHLTINGQDAGTHSGGYEWSKSIEVPAGDVTIAGENTAGSGYTRIEKIEFYALDKVRDDSWIAPNELGTICYPNGHVVVGADVYQMAGVDSNNKFVFDEVTVTEPGKPYLFVAKSYDPIKFYKTTAAAAAVAGTSNGMVGTFNNLDLSTSDSRASKWYYFAGTKFYSVAKYTGSAVSIPANRAYVDMNESHPASAPKFGVRRISFDVQGTNAATGFENAEATEAPRKVMINGTLFIFRGEKMYDATGRLVK
jgi:hypothetical protein